MEKKVINLLDGISNPQNYRKARGYCWAKYVAVRDSWTEDHKKADLWGGFDADFAKSIPGDDRDIHGKDVTKVRQEIKKELEKEYGPLEVAYQSNYGWLSAGEVVATVNAMWRGGDTAYYYKPLSSKRAESLDVIVSTEQTEAIDLMIQDKENENHPGYCKKCHTYCYGDCEA